MSDLKTTLFFSFICLLILSTPLAAAPWYQFEMIIFERISPSAGNTEVWPADPGSPSTANTIHLSLVPGKTQHGTAAYKPLPQSEWRLADHEQRLKRSRNYRPLAHVAWRQQMTSPQKAQRLYLKRLQPSQSQLTQNTPAKLEGTIKVGIKRYLHLETDLLLHRLKMPNSSGSQPGQSDFGPYYQPYRMQAKRRLRSGELHYLDHPVIGVLFLASKYRPSAPVSSVSVESEPSEDKPENTIEQSVTEPAN